ncbi:MAG TPA: baseplate J/gp47 family protein, partial [Terracidiphilus sp.]
KPSSTVYATLNESDGTTDVLFGDGVEGATLPTGQNNIKATYRVGSGTDSNVAARSISTLVDRPLGVSNVTNPEAANGGQDPQTLSGIRANAPSSVLTLGRAVSISDYQNFAANFGGIAKASALWIPSGLGRGVFLTLAGAGGAALPPGNPTLANLVAALVSYGCPHTPIHAVSFLETLFSIRANVAYNPDYNSDQVKARIVDSLRTTYSFSNRGFGQGVGADEIAALIQNIEGVVAVTVAAITLGPTSKAGDLAAANWSLYAYDQWLSQTVTVNRLSSGDPNRICPWIPVATPGDLPIGAEILVLDPGPNAILLGVLQ